MSDDRWSNSPQRTFDRMIGPVLSGMETARLESLAASKNRLFLGGPPALAGVAGTGWYFWGGEHVLTALLIIGPIFGLALWTWVAQPKSRFVDEQRKTVLEAVCSTVGGLTYTHKVAANDFPLATYRTAKIIPMHTYANMEDLLNGTYRDCTFSLVEAELKRKANKSTKTVFNGLLLRISLPNAVRSPINIVHDQSGWGTFAQSLAGWFVPGNLVAIPHDAFEEKYDVYSSDEAEALSILTPAFIQNFLALPKVLGSDKIMAGFTDAVFLVSVDETAPFLDSFSADQPVNELRDGFEHIVEEVRVIHRVIDQLLEGDRYASRA